MKTDHVCNDLFIYICANCIPQGNRLPRQWKTGDLHVQVRMLPCTGKLTTQYLFHAFEGGSRGVCVLACPEGKCALSQGNYRARIRVNNVKRLLGEIGLEPERIELLHFSKDDSFENLEGMIKTAVDGFCRMKENPVYAMNK
jgi:coenzyme F420-reducing hydrogenase delta subunit